ncbi:S8 family serine peptidase [Rummeliibacillus pycnus]|uniref:S8 family serine peptidase n=1 Tax=Rummeliibacillus pycnus TaxID=101070 RepID=UPI0014744CEC|nr:S8 family serine peptidase [Rummeliibacillus pycnus]
MNYKKWMTTLGTTFIASIAFPFFAHATSNQYDDVMIVYKNNDGKEQIMQHAVKIEHTYENLKTIEGTFTSDSISALKSFPDIKVVEKNPKFIEPLDTTSSQLATITPDWNLQSINVQNAWSSGLTGENVKVAVIDTGVAINNALPNVKRYSFVDDDPRTWIDESTPYDTDGHGTFVSGIIAAGITSYNGNHLAGIAPNVSLFSLKVFTKDGATMESLLKALEWSIEHHIDIVNMSLGTPVDDPILKNAVEKAYNAGLTLVAAAGNDGVGKDVEYPAKYDQVIAVSSVDQNNQISYFSNTGSKVEFSAPGSDVYSLGLQNNIAQESGTSFSAPHVTGFLALLKQQYPNYSNDQLRKILRNYTIDLGSIGKDPYYGYGLVNYEQKTPDDVQNLVVKDITKSSAIISYTPTENPVVPTQKYYIYVNNQLVATTTNLQYTLTNLKGGTSYKVLVEAVSADNVTTQGKEISFETIKPTEEEQYVENHQSVIRSWLGLLANKKKIAFNTQFASLYSIYPGLTGSQKAMISKYNKKINLVAISATSRSSYIKATNLTSMKTKKSTTITFATAIKPATLTTNNVYVLSAGKRITGFTLKKDSKGKTIKLSTSKNLAKGNYVIFIDNKGVKTSKGKATSKPFAIKFTVK